VHVTEYKHDKMNDLLVVK